jgi:hypothetical protein
VNAIRAAVSVVACAVLATSCNNKTPSTSSPTAAQTAASTAAQTAAPSGATGPGTSADQPVVTSSSNDGPGRGTPTVVSVGDSYISGEGGRWAGNIDYNGSLSSKAIDALGPSAYSDNADHTAETIVGCHRSKSAAIHIETVQNGPHVDSINLACSGATTQTTPKTPNSKEDFKPGLDNFGDTDGVLITDEPVVAGARVSQSVALRQTAKTHNVKMVAVSIGGNDFHFADTVTDCVVDFLTSLAIRKNLCQDDEVASNFTAASAAQRQSDISNALRNVHDAMTGAGYDDTMWTLVVETPPLPIPGSSAFRYPESGFTRQAVGGCGFWNSDADWAITTVLPVVRSTITAAAKGLPFPNVRVLDLTDAFKGHRLCENTVGTLDDEHLNSWSDPGAADKTEWIVPIRGIVNSDILGSRTAYQKLESFHPNYWGQLALRNCLRQVYNDGTIRGGNCSAGSAGLTDLGEPQTHLDPS